MSSEWDVALSGWKAKEGKAPRMLLQFPPALTAAMADREYNRAKLTLVDEGILVAPYHDDGSDTSRVRQTVELPEAWT